MHGLPSAADIWDLCARGRLCSRRPLWLEAKGVLAIWPLLWQLSITVVDVHGPVTMQGGPILCPLNRADFHYPCFIKEATDMWS